MRADLARVVAFLNEKRVRATYKAVGEAIEVSARSVGGMLGARRPEASWIVNAETGSPTGYERDEMHPELYDEDTIIDSGCDLLRRMAGVR